ncbi:MAG: NnrS family protein [Hyphomicrobiaceae bacterium]
MLIMLIGGRIIPSFTRNWLARQPAGRMPVPFNRFDVVAMLSGGAALVSWCAMPEHALTIALTAGAAILHAVRLTRWAGDRSLAEPLVFILHIAYAFVPIGFVLVTLAACVPDALAAGDAIHAWTTGSIGLMTLAVMTRASLGHAGRALTAKPTIQAIYVFAVIAALTRLIAAFQIETTTMINVSAASWVLAFGGFVIVYWPMLTRARAMSTDSSCQQ